MKKAGILAVILAIICLPLGIISKLTKMYRK